MRSAMPMEAAEEQPTGTQVALQREAVEVQPMTVPWAPMKMTKKRSLFQHPVVEAEVPISAVGADLQHSGRKHVAHVLRPFFTIIP